MNGSRLAKRPALVSRKRLIGWRMEALSGFADKAKILRPHLGNASSEKASREAK
jgi:hypothetical protein